MEISEALFKFKACSQSSLFEACLLKNRGLRSTQIFELWIIDLKDVHLSKKKLEIDTFYLALSLSWFWKIMGRS